MSLAPPVVDAAPDWDDITADLKATIEPRTQVVRPIARGGMGMVFLARDVLLDRLVAIKVLAPELVPDEVARRRFSFEAQAAAAVGHPNVVAIFAVGETVAIHAPYFVMQFVEGGSLQEAYPAGTPAPAAPALRIIGEVASALAAAHARQVVHRDIKPSNVMIERESGRALVVDFGISSGLAVTPKDGRLTGTGLYLGTPAFTSPEQASGEQATDRSDVYGLGCLAFELLTGRPVFDEKTPMAMIAAHLKDTPLSLVRLRTDLDTNVGMLLDRCLAKDPAARPSAAELVRAILPGGDAEVEWPPPGSSAAVAASLRDDASTAGWMWSGSLLVLAMLLRESRFASSVTGFGIDWSQTLIGVVGIGAALMLPAYLWWRLRMLVRRWRFDRRLRAEGGTAGEGMMLVATDATTAALVLNRRGRFADLSSQDASTLLNRLISLETATQLLAAVAPIWWVGAVFLSPSIALMAPFVAAAPLAAWLLVLHRVRVITRVRATTRVSMEAPVASAVVRRWRERNAPLFPRNKWRAARGIALALSPIAAGAVIALGLVVWHAWNNYGIQIQMAQAYQSIASGQVGIRTREDDTTPARSRVQLDSLFGILAGPMRGTSETGRRAARADLLREIAADPRRAQRANDWWPEVIPGLPPYSPRGTDALRVRPSEDSILRSVIRQPDRATVRRHEPLLRRIAAQPILDAAVAQARMDGDTPYWWVSAKWADSVGPGRLSGLPLTISLPVARGLMARVLLMWVRGDAAAARAARADHAAFVRATTLTWPSSGAWASQVQLNAALAVYDTIASMGGVSDVKLVLAARDLALRLRLTDRAVTNEFGFDAENGNDSSAARLAADRGLPTHMRAEFVHHWRSFACRSVLAPIIGVRSADAAAAIHVFEGLADIDTTRVLRTAIVAGLRIFNERPWLDTHRWGGVRQPQSWEYVPVLGTIASRWYICRNRVAWSQG